MSALRSRQKALARRTILDALAGLVTERRHLDFSVQEVADRADVSLRTVYNHFAGREALLDGLSEHFNTMMEERGGVMIGAVSSTAEMREAAGINFRIFEEFSALTEAWQQLSQTTGHAQADHRARTQRMVELVAADLPAAPEADVREVGLLIRHLLSQRTWWALTRGLGLSTDETVRVTTWAADVLMAAAADGDLPSVPAHSPPPTTKE